MKPLARSPEPPGALRARYAGWNWRVAYQYGPPALTYRIENRAGEVRFLKLAREDFYPSLEDEAARARWARAHLPVPDVVESGADGGLAWLVTEGLSGPRSGRRRPQRAEVLRRGFEVAREGMRFDL